MLRASATTKGPGWPVPAVLTACYLLASAGCHPVDLPSGPSGDVDPSIFEPGDPPTGSRSRPRGCAARPAAARWTSRSRTSPTRH